MKKFVLMLFLTLLTAIIFTACSSESDQPNTIVSNQLDAVDQSGQKQDQEQPTQDTDNDQPTALNDPATEQPDSPPPLPVVGYEITEVEDISTATLKRFNYRVIVKEPANIEQLKQVCQAVADEAKQKDMFNAIAIYLSDQNYYPGTPTLGHAFYTIDGDFSKADMIAPGEYQRMEFSWHLQRKNWSLQPTTDETTIINAWFKARSDMRAAGREDPENITTADIASRFNCTSEQVTTMLNKYNAWLLSD